MSGMQMDEGDVRLPAMQSTGGSGRRIIPESGERRRRRTDFAGSNWGYAMNQPNRVKAAMRGDRKARCPFVTPTVGNSMLIQTMPGLIQTMPGLIQTMPGPNWLILERRA
jgi:hypothetical protein